ncbi:hypothetical protein E2C01_023916 [Portunus trituberculatus]|uniref:Uncharacterized protein n=1 Tax=Portunus trituberculatus TaxID=210409 RepID=A0A5B7EAJ6_PORTR|nr:hypothetical protein [Portunus trituberculatus]
MSVVSESSERKGKSHQEREQDRCAKSADILASLWAIFAANGWQKPTLTGQPIVSETWAFWSFTSDPASLHLTYHPDAYSKTQVLFFLLVRLQCRGKFKSARGSTPAQSAPRLGMRSASNNLLVTQPAFPL